MIPESYGIERVDISALTAFSGNPRTHSDTQIDQIAASIREFGWTNAILVDAEGTIIASHGRLRPTTSTTPMRQRTRPSPRTAAS